MTTQRKIHHLLNSEGTGQSFQYLRELHLPFDLSQPILVTEKVDGSTMQSQEGQPFKRYDRIKKGDPRKFEASEEERYELRPLTAGDPAAKWYQASFDSQRQRFEDFGRRWPRFWIYFEALGAKVGRRYDGLEPTVRVFDVSLDGQYLPFETAVEMAQAVGLPTVAHRYQTFGTLDNLIRALKEETSRDSNLPGHQVEGWVLRQGDLIAKIRVADLAKLKSTP